MHNKMRYENPTGGSSVTERKDWTFPVNYDVTTDLMVVL